MFDSIANIATFLASLLGALAAAYLIPSIRQNMARRKPHVGSQKPWTVETRSAMERVSYLSVQIALALILVVYLGDRIFNAFFR